MAGKLEARTEEAGRLRRQVALLHRWCSPSWPLHHHSDPDHLADPEYLGGQSFWQAAPQMGAEGADWHRRSARAEWPRRRAPTNGTGYNFDDGPAEAWEDQDADADSDGWRPSGRRAAQGRGRGATRRVHRRADEPWTQGGEAEEEERREEAEVETRLQELAALRALRKSIQSMRSAQGLAPQQARTDQAMDDGPARGDARDAPDKSRGAAAPEAPEAPVDVQVSEAAAEDVQGTAAGGADTRPDSPSVHAGGD